MACITGNMKRMWYRMQMQPYWLQMRHLSHAWQPVRIVWVGWKRHVIGIRGMQKPKSQRAVGRLARRN